MGKSFEHKVLLSIRRQYSKDEAFSFISDKLRETEIELGKWKSYAHELEGKQSHKQLSVARHLKEMHDSLKKQKEQNKELRRQLEECRDNLRQEFNRIKKTRTYILLHDRWKKANALVSSLRVKNSELMSKIYQFENPTEKP